MARKIKCWAISRRRVRKLKTPSRNSSVSITSDSSSPSIGAASPPSSSVDGDEESDGLVVRLMKFRPARVPRISNGRVEDEINVTENVELVSRIGVKSEIGGSCNNETQDRSEEHT